ncbi:hypothetical protein Vadar_022361 [Vaccinium darrowii]|uniref:Uncharacterized protein n=1 Tax=Vaccinium darrowii TaxID=229202 RepID=A0ACB7YGA6_9ERIC|nr:hypothetical protein Vadar_022361 [Vaccinium darrowii]
MDSDEEDFVFYGTPIEREEEVTSRKKKAVADASGLLRTLPPWKQEVTDEEGRRRFHGAFTGGYSAGYYNTVGSKEGWVPQTFTSSRKNRAEIRQQSILNFLDDDEKVELEGHSLGTSMKFDTFGFTAAELARKQAEKEQQQRPSIIPGPAPDELVLPATDSIGVKLLLKMGWRHGHAIKDSRTNSLYDARREARKAFLALSSDDKAAQHTGSDDVKGDLENVVELPMDNDHQSPHSTPVYVLNPKQDLHGLGYDPFKHAPEFREKKRSRLHEDKESANRKPLSIKDNLFAFRSGRVAPGFGIGALEELDAEDEDVYASGYDFEETYVQEIEEPTKQVVDKVKKRSGKEQGVLPGFKVASNSDYQLERFDPPVIPKDFVPCHKFPAPLDMNNRFSDAPPPEIPPPEDNNLKILIEGVAAIVARCGKLFEDLSREKNQSNPLFSFLNGGDGHDYYSRKLWEGRQKRTDGKKLELDGKVVSSVQKMTAESRGNILGERPLERTSKDLSLASTSTDVQLQFHLSDTFTKPESFNEVPDAAKPFRDDPAKQGRFEQFLKDKYHGGLRSKDSSGASDMSEAARARERLEFEAAAEAIGKGNWGKEISQSNQQMRDMSINTGLQFTPAGLEKVTQVEQLMKKMYPKREEFPWRPSSILCKRFDILDPYMGKPPPPPRLRSKMDSLIFIPDSVKPVKVEETAAAFTDSVSVLPPGSEDISSKEATGEFQNDVEVENVERPVDLYKAIFSDDSDDEGENSSPKQVEDPEKKIGAASTTLNRLIAGDFLESLGKELGLDVPPDLPDLENRTRVSASHQDTVNSKKGNVNILEVQNTLTETLSSENNRSGEVELGKVAQVDRHRNRASRSPEDERSRKRSRRHRRRSSNSDSETTSSDDYRDLPHSRSKGREKGSSREKSSSRKHSKHHKHERGDSLSRSHHGSEKERGDAKREKRR